MKSAPNKVNNKSGDWEVLLMLPILIPLLLLVLFVFLLMSPFLYFQDQQHKSKIRRFLQQNDYTYFFIYSSGKKKAGYIEKHILNTLNPGVEVVKYDGSRYDRFFDPETYFHVVNPSEKGYPIIGKIEEGKVYTESLKEEFEQLVLKEKEIARFIDLLHHKIDDL